MSINATSARQTQSVQIRHYRMADGVLRVLAESEQAMQIWAANIHKYCLIPLLTSASEKIIGTVELLCNEQRPSVPADLPVEKIEHGQCWAKGEALWLEIAGSLIFISERAENTVRVWFGPDARGCPATTLDMVIAYALPSAIRRSGFYELHAAGLIAPQTNTGVLVIGDSGCGKSTLTMRLAGSGWHYLSDDLVLLQQKASPVTAWGLRRVFALTPETLQFCAPAPLQRSEPVQTDKHFFDPQTIFPERAAMSCAPKALFFPVLTNEAKTRLEPLSASTAMMRLLRQSSWLCYDSVVARQHLQALTQLAQQCRAFHIHAGRDLLLEPALANDLLRATLS